MTSPKNQRLRNRGSWIALVLGTLVFGVPGCRSHPNPRQVPSGHYLPTPEESENHSFGVLAKLLPGEDLSSYRRTKAITSCRSAEQRSCDYVFRTTHHVDGVFSFIRLEYDLRDGLLSIRRFSRGRARNADQHKVITQHPFTAKSTISEASLVLSLDEALGDFAVESDILVEHLLACACSIIPDVQPDQLEFVSGSWGGMGDDSGMYYIQSLTVRNTSDPLSGYKFWRIETSVREGVPIITKLMEGTARNGEDMDILEEQELLPTGHQIQVR